MNYDLYWSPEGRKIASVEASDSMSAKRKAPQPYRKFLGEIYATNAFVGRVSLWSEGFLLGGTKLHESSPFVSEADARAWAVRGEEVNRNRPGYANADITIDILPTFSSNPIPEVR